MRIKQFLVIIFLQCSLAGWSQSAAPEYKDWLADFNEIYGKLVQPPLVNSYEMLDKLGTHAFNFSNPLFIKALRATMNEFHLGEAAAIDTLFGRSYGTLRTDMAWEPVSNIYKEFGSYFDLYSNKLCACITSKIKNREMMNELAQAFQICQATIVRDTAYVAKVKAVMGNRSLADLNRWQQYGALYVYQHCDVVNEMFNNVVNSSTRGKLQTEKSLQKQAQAKDMIRLFRTKKYDSLAVLFPDYKKYTAALTKLSAKAAVKDAQFHAFYLDRVSGQKDKTMLSVITTIGVIADSEISYASNDMDALITGVVLKPVKGLKKSSGEDEIIEIKEDQVVPIGTH